MTSRRRAREEALKLLFRLDLTGESPDEAIAEALSESNIDQRAREFVGDLCRGVAGRLTEIDDLLCRFTTGWTGERLAATDRNVLRMAVYEILYSEDVPVAVVINEAVELAKKFGTQDSGRFVNGVLGSIAKEKTEDFQSQR